jgi:hypothetical protein
VVGNREGMHQPEMKIIAVQNLIVAAWNRGYMLGQPAEAVDQGAYESPLPPTGWSPEAA